ncbi:MAG: hypothetical protein K2J70_06295 [Muribaculaceae bacterium]|nr:hypothetical protein [Muribaculaceae bacterium]
MDITEITTMLGTIVGIITPLGGFGAWQYRKQNKRLKEAETKLAEVNVDNAKMQGKSEEWRIWKEQNEALSELNQKLTDRNEKLVKMNADKEDRHQQDIKDWEERFTNQTTYLRGVQRDLIAANEREKEHIRREAVLERRIAYLFTWICKKADCDHGEPPRERLKGHVFKDKEAEEIESENNVTINLVASDKV